MTIYQEKLFFHARFIKRNISYLSKESPTKVIMDYITPVNAIDELVFVSRSDISR